MSAASHIRKTAEKIDLFRSYFTGLSHVYGTYDPVSRRSWQEKKPVTSETILAHLKGKRHYGVYLLVKDTIRAIAADFDHHDPQSRWNSSRQPSIIAYQPILSSANQKVSTFGSFFKRRGLRLAKPDWCLKRFSTRLKLIKRKYSPNRITWIPGLRPVISFILPYSAGLSRKGGRFLLFRRL